MTYFTLPDFGALAAKVPQVIRRVFRSRTAEMADATRTHAAAMAATEASQDPRIKAILAPLWEAIERVHAKLDAILAKLE